VQPFLSPDDARLPHNRHPERPEQTGEQTKSRTESSCGNPPGNPPRRLLPGAPPQARSKRPAIGDANHTRN